MGGIENEHRIVLMIIEDLFSYRTNHENAVSRAVSHPDRSGEKGYSIPYFCHPVGNVKFVPIPSRRVTAAYYCDENGLAKILHLQESTCKIGFPQYSDLRHRANRHMINGYRILDSYAVSGTVPKLSTEQYGVIHLQTP